MADEDKKDDGGPPWRLKAWQGRLIAVLLVVAGAVHAFKPVWLTLDWPTIALILSGVLLLFVPLEDIGSVIESLEFGKTKLTLRKGNSLIRVSSVPLARGLRQQPFLHLRMLRKTKMSQARQSRPAPLASRARPGATSSKIPEIGHCGIPTQT